MEPEVSGEVCSLMQNARHGGVLCSDELEVERVKHKTLSLSFKEWLEYFVPLSILVSRFDSVIDSGSPTSQS